MDTYRDARKTRRTAQVIIAAIDAISALPIESKRAPITCTREWGMNGRCEYVDVDLSGLRNYMDRIAISDLFKQLIGDAGMIDNDTLRISTNF